MNIIKYPDPILRQKCALITDFGSGTCTTKWLNYLWTQMYYTMMDAGGIGLAAPQVGRSIQLCVINLGGNKPLHMINPMVSWRVGVPLVTLEEGCLSLPGIKGLVARPDEIRVSYQDEWGYNTTLCCNGLLARVIQHEQDHLHGVLFIDRMSKKNLKALGDWEKQIR